MTMPDRPLDFFYSNQSQLLTLVASEREALDTKLYIKKFRRENSFLLLDANERYLYFLNQLPFSYSRISLFIVHPTLGSILKR